MFQTTRFFRPMLKSARLPFLVLLAAASFGAPAFSAEETRICCFVPDYHSNLPVPNYSQPVPNYRQPVPNYSQPVPNYRRAVVPNYRRRLPYWVPGHWVIGPHGGQQWVPGHWR
jgi:hypothetical protein